MKINVLALHSDSKIGFAMREKDKYDFRHFFVYVVLKLKTLSTWARILIKKETCCTNLEQGKSGIAIRVKGDGFLGN